MTDTPTYDGSLDEPLDRREAATYQAEIEQLYPGDSALLLHSLCTPHIEHEHSGQSCKLRQRGKVPIRTKWNEKALERWKVRETLDRGVPIIAASHHLAAGGNIGWVVPPGFLVLDCDTHEVTGWVVAELMPLLGQFPHQISQPGRAHFLVRLPSSLDIDEAFQSGAGRRGSQASRYLPCGKVDLRLSGRGQIVCEPSTHAVALCEYRWQVPLPEHLEDVPEIPGDLLKTLIDAPTNKGSLTNSNASLSDTRLPPRSTLGARAGKDFIYDATAHPERKGGRSGRHEAIRSFLAAMVLKHEKVESWELLALLDAYIEQECDQDPPITSDYRNTQVHDALNYGKKQRKLDLSQSNVNTSWGLGATETDTSVPAGTVVLFQRMSEIEPVSIDWLWNQHLPIGKLVLVDGDPNARKSTLMADWAAIVSTGRPWPDGDAHSDSGGVVMVSGEDDAADTIVPRLMAAGADLDRVINLQPPAFGSFVDDLDVLMAAVSSVSARIVILDPIMMFLGGVKDAHKDNEVRAALADLLACARGRQFVVVGIRHNRKSGGRAIHSGSGSIAWTAAARAVFQVTNEPNSEWSLLSVTKANLAPPSVLMSSRRYTSHRLPGKLDQAVRIEYGDMIELTANQAMAQARAEEESVTAKSEAKEWLRSQLSSGPVPTSDLKLRAKGYSIAWRTVERAKEGVAKAVKKRDGWYYELIETESA